MSTKTRAHEIAGEESRGTTTELKAAVSRDYALTKAAQILLSNNIVSENKVIEAYFLLAKEQRKGNLEYPVDYEFVVDAIKIAKKLKRLREKK